MTDSTKPSRREIWHHHPPLPIPDTPVFDWPPRLPDALRWISNRWIHITASTLFLVVAILIFNFGLLPGDKATSLSPGWILGVWLRNITLLLLFAGSLHLWLFTFSGQGKRFKFDAQPMKRNHKRFSFGNQVYDNMFWTLSSGVAAMTFFEVLYWWAVANDVVPVMAFSGAELWFFVWIIALPIISSTHFYWVHRLLHWPPLYRKVHALHHRSVNIGPWSGISMHPVESLLYMSDLLIHFFIPTHPVIFLLHLYTRAIIPAFTHAGFEKVVAGDTQLVGAGDFYHQLHHRFFECNYGTADTPWDRWFGSFHDGTEAASERIRQRVRERVLKSNRSNQ